MASDLINDGQKAISFIQLLKKELPDKRDNRGKRHTLEFVIVAFVLATLMGRKKLSGIHRFICNRLDWLHELTRTEKGKPISRAHLPRLLKGLDWLALNRLIEQCFAVTLTAGEDQQWVAVDGKTLCGTVAGADKQALVMAVTHNSGEVVCQARQEGPKSSEINVARALLKDSGLEKQKTSLDAHHCNPETTAQINTAGGIYLVQVKDNQAVLLQQCRDLPATTNCLAEIIDHDKGHGRVTTRHAQLFSLASVALAGRWQHSGLTVCVVMKRETWQAKTKKTSRETAYYLSNQALGPCAPPAAEADLVAAIRRHWGVEANNWVRDVTFGEDGVKTKAGNQGQIMGRLRSLAIALLRKTKSTNLPATIDSFVDSVPALESMLRQVNFL